MGSAHPDELVGSPPTEVFNEWFGFLVDVRDAVPA